MPYPELRAVLTDIGTEELGHLEMIGTIVYQLTRNLTIDEIKASGYQEYFVDHTTGVYATSASGSPWTAAGIQSKGDVIADLVEDMAADDKTKWHNQKDKNKPATPLISSLKTNKKRQDFLAHF